VASGYTHMGLFSLLHNSLEITRDKEYRELLRVWTSLFRDRVHHAYGRHYFSRQRSSLCDFDTNKIARVRLNPDRIQHRVTLSSKERAYCPCYGENAVVGEVAGIWDLIRKPIEQTSQYERYIRALETGEDVKGVEVLRSMQKDGYRPQHELDGNTRAIRGKEIWDEPRLAVSRHNEPMRWTGGNHRIAAAQLLGVDYIPAYVVVWHPKANRNEFIETFGEKEPKPRPPETC